MADFNNLTLSDFYTFDIGIREDGSATPIIDYEDGKSIGLVGFKGNAADGDNTIRDEAYAYYKRLINEFNNIIV